MVKAHNTWRNCCLGWIGICNGVARTNLKMLQGIGWLQERKKRDWPPRTTFLESFFHGIKDLHYCSMSFLYQWTRTPAIVYCILESSVLYILTNLITGYICVVWMIKAVSISIGLWTLIVLFLVVSVERTLQIKLKFAVSCCWRWNDQYGWRSVLHRLFHIVEFRIQTISVIIRIVALSFRLDSIYWSFFMVVELPFVFFFFFFFFFGSAPALSASSSSSTFAFLTVSVI